MFNAEAQTHLVPRWYTEEQQQKQQSHCFIVTHIGLSLSLSVNPALFLLCVIKRKKGSMEQNINKKTINGFFQQKKRNLDKNGSTKPKAKANISYFIVVYRNSKLSSACVFECMSFQCCINAKYVSLFFVGFVVVGPLCGRPQPSHYMCITQI